MYAAAGLKVQTILMDMEFDSLKPLLPQVVINTPAANEHVAEIERRICVIKEHARTTLTTLPFYKIPKMITIELIQFVTIWLNKSSMEVRASGALVNCSHDTGLTPNSIAAPLLTLTAKFTMSLHLQIQW